MPSDAKKKREQKKKEAAKAKQSGKKVENKEEKEVSDCGGSWESHTATFFLWTVKTK